MQGLYHWITKLEIFPLWKIIVPIANCSYLVLGILTTAIKVKS